MRRLSNDEFMQILRDGGEMGPTDKTYKVYVTHPGGEDKFYFEDLTLEQKREFVDIYNSKQMNIGYPGYFYTLPFFMVSIPIPIIEEEPELY